MPFPTKKIYLVRHGETEWTLSGQHTGSTDIPLTLNGEQQARMLRDKLAHLSPLSVFTSPLQRASRTCELAGFHQAQIDPDLVEWNYGDYEGLTSQKIHKTQPDWTIFKNGAPHGESLKDVQSRADRILSKLEEIQGNIMLFSHGHFLRVLATRWLQLPVQDGRLFALFPASVSILGFEKNTKVLQLWNSTFNFNL
jgi:broad specificity phosphatase PhoE